MALIGIDVDQCIVPTCWQWANWVEKRYGKVVKHYSKKYDNEKYMIWWKDKYLYDCIYPFPDAIKFINKLAEEHQIWFITKCFDEHIESKKRFCDKYFKYNRFFNSSFNKGECFDGVLHYMIDDRPSILDTFKKTKTYRINYSVEPSDDKYLLMSWKEIYEEINKEK